MKDHEIIGGFYAIATSTHLVLLENLVFKDGLSLLEKGKALIAYFNFIESLPSQGLKGIGLVSSENQKMLKAYKRMGHKVSDKTFYLISQGGA